MTAPLRLAYTLTLTPDEYRTLAWLKDRGYAGRLISSATDADADTDADPAVVTLRYTESAAWDAVDASGDDDPDFGTCAGPELCAKMWVFRDSIV